MDSVDSSPANMLRYTGPARARRHVCRARLCCPRLFNCPRDYWRDAHRRRADDQPPLLHTATQATARAATAAATLATVAVASAPPTGTAAPTPTGTTAATRLA